MAEVAKWWQVRQALQHAVQVAGVAHVEQASTSTIGCPVPSALQRNHLQQQMQQLSTTGHTSSSMLLLRDHTPKIMTYRILDDSRGAWEQPKTDC